MDTTKVSRTSWAGPVAILVIHALALGLLFLQVAFISYSFVDHYNMLGIATTPSFDKLHSIADFLSKYKIAFIALLMIDGMAIRWLAARPARWLSAYSHTFLVSVVFAMFVAFTWMIHPMVWNVPAPGIGPANQAVAAAMQ